jgi:type IV pilus assembly protein PilN
MKIPINLASQPFRRDRAMIAASICVIAMLVATLGALIALALQDRAQLADVRREVGALSRQVRGIQGQKQQYDAILRMPQNAEVLERSVFLNTLLLRKGISWTRIFADLENVVPHNVRILQIRPSVSGRDGVALDMVVGAESPAALVDLLKALGDSPLFGPPNWHSTQPPTQAEPLYRLRLSVNYAQKL